MGGWVKTLTEQLNSMLNQLYPAISEAEAWLRNHRDPIPFRSRLEIPMLCLRWTQDSINRKMVFGHRGEDDESIYKLVCSSVRLSGFLTSGMGNLSWEGVPSSSVRLFVCLAFPNWEDGIRGEDDRASLAERSLEDAPCCQLIATRSDCWFAKEQPADVDTFLNTSSSVLSLGGERSRTAE